MQLAVPDVEQVGVLDVLHALLLQPFTASLDLFLTALTNLLSTDEAFPSQVTITGEGQLTRLDHFTDQAVDQAVDSLFELS